LGKSGEKCLREINRNLSTGKMLRNRIIFLSKTKPFLASKLAGAVARGLPNA
jgi:hypothetical protein